MCWYRNSSFSQLNPLDFAQFVFRLFSCDTVHREPPFSVIYQTEILACFFDSDDIHKSSRECCIGPHFCVYFDQTLHNNGLGFASVESIFQSAIWISTLLMKFKKISRGLTGSG